MSPATSGMIVFFCCSLFVKLFFSDIEKIQSGIGEKAAYFLQYFVTFIAGFILAFTIDWKLTLVLSIMLPLLGFLGASFAKVSISRVYYYTLNSSFYHLLCTIFS